jgi:hypothetical protein
VPDRAAPYWAVPLKPNGLKWVRSPTPGVVYRSGLLVTQAAIALLWGVAVADDPKQADLGTDAELLEFLGSVDSGADSQATTDDGSWIDYLAQTDITKVAKSGDPKDASRKPSPSDAPAPGDKKND